MADALQQRGVGPDTLVGLWLPRSPAFFLAVLAVLKAGGAYVALDPAYPLERLTRMVTIAQVALILTVEDLPGPVLAPSVPRLLLERQAPPLPLYPASPPP